MKKLCASINKKILLLFALIFTVLFIFNSLTPLLADDFNYSYSWRTDARIRTLWDVVLSMHTHWYAWHGRVIANGLTSFFTIYPKYVFNIVNSLVSTAVAAQIYYITRLFAANRKRTIFPLAAALIILWCFCPSFGQAFLWMNGSTNYSWTLFFIFIFLIPYFAAYTCDNFKLSAAAELFLLLEAFVAGGYNESGSISALFIAGCLLILIGIYKRRVPRVLVLNLIVGLAGFIWLMTAPSMRRGGRGSFSLEAVLSLFAKLFGLISEFVSCHPLCSALLLILTLILLLWLYRVRRQRKLLCLSLFAAVALICAVVFFITVSRRVSAATSLIQLIQLGISAPEGNVIMSCLVFAALFIAAIYYRVDIRLMLPVIVVFLGGLGSAVAFLFAAYIPTRGFLYITAYLSLCSALLLQELIYSGAIRPVRLMKCVLTFLFVLYFTFGAADIIYTGQQASVRNAIIAEAQADGRDITLLPIFICKTKYSPAYGLVDVNPELDWPCDSYTVYYGLKTVKGV